MKITRKQLRRLIETTVFPKNPVDYVSDPEQKKKINTLISAGDETNQRTGYDLASMLQDEGGYEGDDYMDDLKNAQQKQVIDSLLAFVPEISFLYSSNDPKDLEMWNALTRTLSDPAGVKLLVYVDDYIADEVDLPGRFTDSIVNNPRTISGLTLDSISGISTDLMSKSDFEQIIDRISDSPEAPHSMQTLKKLLHFIHNNLDYTAGELMWGYSY